MSGEYESGASVSHCGDRGVVAHVGAVRFTVCELMFRAVAAVELVRG